MTVLATILGVLLLAGLIAAIVICVQKGKSQLALFTLLIFGGPIVVIVGAIRLAKPDSKWARGRYDETKITQARERFSVEAAFATQDRNELAAQWAGEDINPDELDRVTRRALRKNGLL